MNFAEIKEAAFDGVRIDGAAHEELLWYQLREIEAARKRLVAPDKIAQRLHKVKVAFEINCRHEEIASGAIAKISELRIISTEAASDYMKNRCMKNADRLIQVFDNLPTYGERVTPSVSCADSSLEEGAKAGGDDTSSTASGPPSPRGEGNGEE